MTMRRQKAPINVKCMEEVNVNVNFRDYKDIIVLSYLPDLSFMLIYDIDDEVDIV